MSRDLATKCFREMGIADQIVIDAVEAIREAGVDTSFSILSMLNHGVVRQSKEMTLEEERAYLVFMEEYLADTRNKLGMEPHQSFTEVEL